VFNYELAIHNLLKLETKRGQKTLPHVKRIVLVQQYHTHRHGISDHVSRLILIHCHRISSFLQLLRVLLFIDVYQQW